MKKQNITQEMLIQRDKQVERLEQILRDITIIIYNAEQNKTAMANCLSDIFLLIFKYFHPNVKQKL